MTRQAGALIGLTAVVSFLLGLVSAGTRSDGRASPIDVMPLPASAGRTAPLSITTGAWTPAPSGAGVDFAAVAARMNAAVVNVDNASRGGADRPRGYGQRYPRDGSNGPREGSGSGFIVDPAGYVLTNYHVIEGADRLTVTLSDGRAFRASVIGIDPAIDVALLQIPVAEPVTVAPLGRSETLRVGEWVCAIGNPLGYVHSVTVGVVSFLGRKVFDQSLDSLIQTDAAITFGNSGGPLINSRGEVVGMTTAVSALASNIGFAIPIDQILAILPQLRENGRVSRGFMGVGLTTVTPALRRALGLGLEHGAVIQDVTPDLPAARAGLRTYDVVVAVDGREIVSDEELIDYVSMRAPGTVAEIDVARDGARVRLSVKLAERPLSEEPRGLGAMAVRPAVSELGPLGLAVRDVDADFRTRQRLPASMQGVLVTNVDAAGPARQAQMIEGQIILEVNRKPVLSAAEFRAVLAGLRPGEPVALLVFDRLSDQRLIATIHPDPPS
jgi:serine protease Do